MNRGFTLIEVLVSLVILSLITVISSSILQSSLDIERTVSQRLHSARSLNFSSIIVKRDIRQAINVPLRDNYGNFLNGVMIGSNIDNKILFNTRVKSISNETSPIKRIEYILEEGTFKRKQFYSANPYNIDEYFDTELISDVSRMNIEFLHERQWHPKWPINSNTEKKIPTLIRFEFEKNGKEYTWIIEPNIDYVF